MSNMLYINYKGKFSKFLYPPMYNGKTNA